ncbi:class I SAM-dependent methyltransferase [Mucilaginibacter sp.]|uniref:class I SAM-dependent methyltransferase n=1 Tax=Mucilaginibacter sp. TaxID=1882438 RepID=UPI000CB822AA|nr:class I SAM-dependent methyltransferase [Mucilaginibacter sp.]PLW90979.1 MAG: SAM-dependent methyltransferase [Mucilaginibacter sp.]PMP66328.1 MAG: SAM-dependent methyltransferase [Mucilaginibacter sp.]HEK21330.1 class I SAM-dependent methyltransferase [Bacteroidota bacterium]
MSYNLNPDPPFEKAYTILRQKEKRTYSDAQVSKLPDIDPGHVHYNEWKIRKQSCTRLITYLKRKKKALKILEVGCGNGWFSAKLSENSQAEIIGLDVNGVEIDQAANVFNKANLRFIHDGFPSERLTGLKFDIVLFAASIQYFASFPAVINEALKHLTEGGEIHITDTPFYQAEELAGAANRSKTYFAGLGQSEMVCYYHYHSINDLMMFNHKVLAKPRQLFNRLCRKIKFPWVMIRC